MRNFNDYISLLEKWSEENGYMLLIKNGIYRLNLSYDSYPEYCSLDWLAKCVIRKMNEKCFNMFGFSLNEIDSSAVYSIDDIKALLFKKANPDVDSYDLVACQMMIEELLLDNLLIQKYMSVPDKVAVKYVNGQISDHEMDALVTIIRKAYAILADEGCQENEIRIKDAALIWQNAAKEYKAQAVIEFQTENPEMTEKDIHTLLNTRVSYLNNSAVEFVPVNKNGFGSLNDYLDSWNETVVEALNRQSIQIPVTGGYLKADIIPYPEYPGIEISYLSDASNLITTLALVEEANDVLVLRSYMDTSQEEPKSIACQYDSYLMSEVAYAYWKKSDSYNGEDFEAFMNFTNGTFFDEETMKAILPQDLLSQYCS